MQKSMHGLVLVPPLPADQSLWECPGLMVDKLLEMTIANLSWEPGKVFEFIRYDHAKVDVLRWVLWLKMQ
jgi:hypothetical protein